MKRFLGLVLLALLAACSAGTKPATRPDTPAMFTAPPRPDSQPRDHLDMTQFASRTTTCDAEAGVTVRKIVEDTVKIPAWSVVRARILKVGAPRWNTPSGKRPTQAEADAIVDGPLEYGGQANPSTYRPVTIQVEKVYSGETRGTLTAYAEGGSVGTDWVTSCGFGSADRLLIRNGPLVATVGESYVMLLQYNLIGTILSQVFLIKDDLVVGLSGKPERLP